MASVTANSRMIYAFSRDGAVPGHRLWHHINPRTRTPTNAVWFAVVFAFILGLPYLGNSTAYGAVTSIATIGLYIAYVIPTLLRRLAGASFVRRALVARPLERRHRLGRHRLGGDNRGAVHAAGGRPDHVEDVQLRPGGGRVVLMFSGGYWLLSARKWFTGPHVQGSEADFERIEARLAKVEQ